jgi:hypothetical protein
MLLSVIRFSRKTCKTFFILGFLFCFYNLADAQQNIVLNGKIVDKHTGQSLPYASIGLSKSSLGTISNQNGEFKIVIPSELINEKIIFSFLGYKTYKIPVKDCIGKNLEIKLSVLPVELKAVNVKYRGPQDLIVAALNAVSDNFPNYPLNLTAFYREEVTENNNPIQFIEAVIQIYKAAYNKKDRDRIRIVKAREHADLKPSVFFNYLYFVNGPYESLSLDIGKYPEDFINVLENSANFLNHRHFKHYTYDFKEAVFDGSTNENYIVTFQPKTKKALLQGKIVLDKQSLAPVTVEFWISENRLADARLISYENEQYINNEGFYTKALNYHCKVNFRKFKNRCIISNSKMDYSFQFIPFSGDETYEISNSIDFVVTEIDEKNIEKFKQFKPVWRNVSLSKQLGKFDSEFWENYNIIKSTDED